MKLKSQLYVLLSSAVSENELEKNINEAKSFFDKMLPKILNFGKTLLIAAILYLVGRKLIKLLLKLMDRIFERSNLDYSVCSFLNSMIRISANILLIIIVAGYLGLETGSLIAVVGSAGLALGLALQGSLSNFAGGVLILILKPFRAGDYIITCGVEGTVAAIDIFYTKLLTIDNQLVVIPNGTLSNSNIVNVTSEPERRLDLLIAIDYGQDIRIVKEILLPLAENHEMVLKEKEISVFVSSFDSSAISIGFRMWVLQENYWLLKWDMLEKIKEAFDRNQIVIPYDQLDVNLAEVAKKS